MTDNFGRLEQFPYAGPPGQSGQNAGDQKAGGWKSLRPRTIWLAAVLLVIIVTLALGWVIKLPYAIFRPGPAQDTLGSTSAGSIIDIQGHQTYKTSGTLDFTTVSVYGGPNYPVNVWEWVSAKFDKDANIVPEEFVFPKELTGEQITQQNTAQMTESQSAAEVVAVRAAGGTVEPQVAEVVKDAPADGILKADDLIKSVNGKPMTTLSQIRETVQALTPGDKVAIEIVRGGATKKVEVPTEKSQDGSTVMGIVMKYKMPYTVKVNAGEVGGPSAGLMFSLAIYDKLTPGEMTGGKKFAGTGTIDIDDETVGRIGGIPQKMIGARDTGADYFLAPAGNCAETKGKVPPGLTVFKVDTFNSAKNIVEKVGKGQLDGLPRC